MSAAEGQPQTVPEALAFWAETTPDAPALLAPKREALTYRALRIAVDRLSAELRARGLGKGDRIALLVPEGPDYCLALLGAISVGVAIPLAWPQPEVEYRRVLDSGHVRAVMVSSSVRLSAEGLADLGIPVITYTPGASGRIGDFDVVGSPLADSSPAPRVADIALILHSSGTTGRPKLVPVTHRAIADTCRTVIEARRLTPADRCLSPVKLVYSQGFHALAIPIVAGAAVISIPGLDIGALPDWLRALAPTYLSVTPAMLRLLAAEREEVQAALRQAPIRSINSTAGALSASEIEVLELRFGAPILNLYGMTEATAIAGERKTGCPRVPGSVGVPWCDLRIVDAEFRPLPATEMGEIVVRGPRVATSYLDDLEATASAFLPGGWFRTGDVGHLDRAGYLHLTGRLGEIINRGGEKIAPNDVDGILRGHPAVADAAVFAVVDHRLGDDIVAAVVLHPGTMLSPRELRTWLRARLAQFKVPRRIWLVQELPRTATGKVQRGELARRWAREHR